MRFLENFYFPFFLSGDFAFRCCVFFFVLFFISILFYFVSNNAQYTLHTTPKKEKRCTHLPLRDRIDEEKNSPEQNTYEMALR